jgi:hypothetical protein
MTKGDFVNRDELKIFLKDNFNYKISTCYQTLKSKYNDIYNYILNETSYLKNVKFTERLYHIINCLDKIPNCIICKKNTNFNGYNKGYSIVCSTVCSNIKRTLYKKITFNGCINREDIRKFLINEIGKDNIINSYQLLKNKFINVYNGIIDITSYLDTNVVFNERLYHIVNYLISIVYYNKLYIILYYNVSYLLHILYISFFIPPKNVY